MTRVALVGAGVTAAALAAVLIASGHHVIMPTRRRELEPNFDLNQLLDDAGNRIERQRRKAERKSRAKTAQVRAFTGEQS